MPLDSIATQAETAFNQGQYDRAIALYEQLAEQQPEKIYVWYLGLSYLLQGEEAAAQLTWAMGLEDADQVDIAELLQILSRVAITQEATGELQTAWVVWQHALELAPDHLESVLSSYRLAVKLGEATAETLVESGLLQLLEASDSIEASDWFSLLQAILEQNLYHPELERLVQRCAGINPGEVIQRLMRQAETLGYIDRNYSLACRYAEWASQLAPDAVRIWSFLAYFYGLEGNYERSIELAQQCYEEGETLSEKLSANAMILRGMLHAGNLWQQALAVLEQHQQLLHQWIDQSDLESTPDFALLTSAFYYFSYLNDVPQQYRVLQNRAAQKCQDQLLAFLDRTPEIDQTFPFYLSSQGERPLRIGYMSAGFRRHSIGWLARWVMQHHDRENFEVYIYLRQQAGISEFTQQWYVDPAAYSRSLTGTPIEMAQTIAQDQIDILVDLDSLTSDHACQIMACKPAPVQVTWLGLDASGIPAVDYFLVDPYVVSEDAQDYYAEKLWRMPQTYVAVDGFEVGVPTLRRDQLGIPENAIVYFSSQAAFKRHPDTVRLQLQIIRAVPNSYFLIKGLGDETQVRQLFEQLAVEENVSIDRLRFLPIEPREESHRANLALADVVLDTFPYNGATTTLETLWMGIPIVTKVGNQFAARNSYTMLINAGITEGIAWSDAEYVKWGVRLGTDAALRNQVANQLRQGRHTAPLWNAKQFTQDLEQAYLQMWQMFIVKPIA